LQEICLSLIITALTGKAKQVERVAASFASMRKYLSHVGLWKEIEFLFIFTIVYSFEMSLVIQSMNGGSATHNVNSEIQVMESHFFTLFTLDSKER
jgi:hypothetical protein